MATINACSGYSAGVPTSAKGLGGFVISNVVDLDNLGVASTDVVQVLTVPKDSAVMRVEVEIVTPSNAATSATATVGDANDADGYIATANLKSSAGSVLSSAGTEAYVSVIVGKRYTSDTFITLTPTYSGTTTVKGKVIVRAFCVKMS